MSVTAFIRRCLDIGMPLEMALAASEAFEAEAPSVVATDERRKEKQRSRQARYEERKRNLTLSDVRNVSEASETSEASADEKEGPQTPKKNTPFPPLKGGTSPKLSASQPEKPKQAEPQKALTSWVSEIWEQTPLKGRQRSGKREAENALKAAVRRGADPAAVKAGLAAYYGSDEATKGGGEYAQGLHRAIQSGKWETFAEPERAAPGDDDPWPGRLMRWRTSAYWNSEWGPKPGKPGYRGPEAQDRAA